MCYILQCGSCLDVLKKVPNDSIDSIVTDPPYELGFMGKRWDASGIAYNVEVWKECLRVLKPGAHMLAFGGTRTYHRMTCAIEDAGFDIRDSLHWFYGSGFPKSLNVGEGRGTGLKPAHEPIMLARKPMEQTVAANIARYGTGAMNIEACKIGTEGRYNASASSNRIYGQFKGTETAGRNTTGRWPANILLDEAAAIELDEQSGETKSPSSYIRPKPGHNVVSYGQGLGEDAGSLSHNFGDVGEAPRFFYVAKPSRKERELGCESLPPKTSVEAVGRDPNSAGALNARAGAGRSAGARMMRCEKCDSEVNEGRYETIAGACDNNEPHEWVVAGMCATIRNYHPTVKPITLMRYLIKLITPPSGKVLDPFVGSGTTGCAAILEGYNFIGIDLSNEYLDIARARMQYWSDVKSNEPESLF